MADSPLQKSPIGLLESFNLKTLGQQPDQFGGMVVPVVETYGMYAIDKLISYETAGAAAAFSLSVTAPVSYARRFEFVEFEVHLGAAVGTYMQLRLSTAPPLSTAGITLAESYFAAPQLVAGNRYSCIAHFPGGLWLPAGTGLQGTAFSDAAGADHVPILRSLSYDTLLNS